MRTYRQVTGLFHGSIQSDNRREKIVKVFSGVLIIRCEIVCYYCADSVLWYIVSLLPSNRFVGYL